MEGILFCPLPSPQEILIKFYTLLSKILAITPPPPLGISNDLPWGGYGFFLDLLYTITVNGKAQK